MSGFSLHINCGEGWRECAREVEAARGSSARAWTHGGTRDARAGGPQRILARRSVPLATAPERTQGFPEVERRKSSGRGARSTGAVAPAAEKFGHGGVRN